MKSIRTEVPDQLSRQVKILVTGGWFKDEEEILQEALRRFLETHSPALLEKFVLQDVEWGLHGKD